MGQLGETTDSFRLILEEDVGVISSPNLCSTLKKLLLWEKKLYFEVKVCFCDSCPAPLYYLIM